MKMVRQECPGEDGSIEPIQIGSYPLQQFLPVQVVMEDDPFLDSPGAYVMNGARKIHTGSTRHNPSNLRISCRVGKFKRSEILPETVSGKKTSGMEQGKNKYVPFLALFFL